MKKQFYEIIKSSLFQTSTIYTFSVVLTRAIPFLLLPILTRYLTPEDYGIVSMFTVLISFTTVFIGLNTHGAIVRNYYEQETVDISVYIFNVFIITILSTMGISVLYIVFGNFISNITGLTYQLIWLAIIVSFSQFIITINLNLWKVQRKAVFFSLYNIIKSLMNVTGSILFVVTLGLAWQGRIYALVLVSLIFFVFSLGYLLKKKFVKPKFSQIYISDALQFGIPLLPHAIGGIVMTLIDRFFITNMVGLEATGIYTVGYQIGMIVSILVISFNHAYQPWLYEKLKLDNLKIKKFIVKFTYIYFVAVLLFAIFLSILTPWFMSVFIDNRYQESSKYVIWIALGYSFKGMYLMVTNYIFYIKKTKYLGYITGFSALINILLNYILISKYGVVGAAQATLLVYLLQFILVWIVASKVYIMPWSFKKLFQIE